MLRALYTFVLCATLALLATMWLRPGIAQDLIALATGVRAQSPDPAAAGPALGSYPTIPFNNVPSAPVQPMPATRPSTWPGAINNPVRATTPPGAAANSSPYAAPNANSYPAPSSNAYPATNAPPTGTGVTVWEPRGNFAAPVPYNGTSAQPAVAPNAMPPGGMNTAPGYAATPTTAAPFAATPGAAQSLAATPAPSGAAQLPSATVSQEVADAQVAARVGSEVILVSDLKASMWQMFEEKNGPIEIKPEEFEQAYQQAAQIILKRMIDMKLISNDAVHTIPAPGLKQAQADINKSFDQEQLPQMMKACKVATRQELEDHLAKRIDRSNGNGARFSRRTFMAVGFINK